MRRFALILLLLAATSIAHADNITQVHMLSVFTGCSGTCFQVFNIGFQYDASDLIFNLPNEPGTDVLPGSFYISSFGFMGTFSGYGHIYSSGPPYMPFHNGLGDELDVDFTFAIPALGTPATVLGMSMWGCVSDACVSGLGLPFPIGAGFHREPTFQIVSQSPVPEPLSLLLLGPGLAGVIGMKRRRGLETTFSPKRKLARDKASLVNSSVDLAPTL